MGSTTRIRRRHRLRARDESGDPQKFRSETTPGIARPGARHRNTTTQANRYRYPRYCVAVFLCLGLSGALVVPPAAAAEAKRCPKYEHLFEQYRLPVATFSRISWRESRCNHRVVSPIRASTGRPDVGLVQISASWSSLTMRICKVKRSQVVKALTNVHCNLRVASYLWADGKGAGNWSVRSGNG